MPLATMPNGEVVDVPEGIAPEVLARIKAQYPVRSRREAVAAGQPRTSRKSAVQIEAERKDKGNGTVHDTIRNVANGFGFNMLDEAQGALSATANSVGNLVGLGNGRGFSEQYHHARDVERELDKRARDRTPIGSIAGEIAGALVNPVGTGVRGLELAGKGVTAAGRGIEALGAARAGKIVSRVGARAPHSGPIVRGIAAGTTQGALNAVGSADEIGNVPGAVLEGGAIGGVMGGALGGAVTGARRGVQVYRDASPANAERTAYSRIAQMLSDGGITPAKATREIAVADARGGDAMVQDLLPSLRAQSGAISRKPGVSASNTLIERGEERIQDRRSRFGQQVRDTADIPAGGDDALARGDTLAATRKADGQAGYAPGGVMDREIVPTDELQKYLTEAPEEVQGALRKAYKNMLLRDENPGTQIHALDTPDGETIFTHIPNLRTFDYVKRSFDEQIGQAIKSNERSIAQGLSYQLDKLKGVLADANPADKEYQALLKSQRDAFQKQSALDKGEEVLGRMSREPRIVLRDLKAMPEHAVDEARIGIIDALINADNKADPVAYYRTLTRNDNQRKIMEFAFGGKGNLGRFERWVNREVRATRADVLTAPGRQSETSRFAMADEGAENSGNILSNAMRGYAFGGKIGAFSGVSRTLKNLATGTTRMTQEEIAKILLSKGEGLVKGVEGATRHAARRKAGNISTAVRVAKAIQQPYTDFVGGE